MPQRTTPPVPTDPAFPVVKRELVDFLKRLNLYDHLSEQEIFHVIYNAKKYKEMQVFDSVIRKAKRINSLLSANQLTDLRMFLHNVVWNHAPIRFLKGKSPSEKMEEEILKNPQQNAMHHPAIKMMMFSFLGMLNEIQHKLKKPSEKSLFRQAVPLIYKRFFYSRLDPQKPDSYPFLMVMQIVNNYGVNDDYLFLFSRQKNGMITSSPLKISSQTWHELPLLFDLKHNTVSYDDPWYIKLHALAKKSGLKKQDVSLSQFIEFFLTNWWSDDPILMRALTLDTWNKLWEHFLRKAVQDVVDTEAVILPILTELKKAGVSVNHILEQTAEWPSVKEGKPTHAELVQEMYFMKLTSDFDKYLLTPLTLYVPVMHLMYADPFNIEEEVRCVFEEKTTEILFKPPTRVTFNMLGRELYKSG